MDDVLCIALHRESLASTGRSIDEDSAVLTVKERIGEGLTIDLREHFLLGRLRVQHLLERIHFLLMPISTSNHNLSLLTILAQLAIHHLNTDRMAIFVRDKGAHTCYHIDGDTTPLLNRCFAVIESARGGYWRLNIVRIHELLDCETLAVFLTTAFGTIIGRDIFILLISRDTLKHSQIMIRLLE